MNLLEKIALVGQRMKSEQISLKESLMASSRVSVSDDSVDGVDRLIYNHCLNKKNLSDFFGKSRVTFNKILSDLEEKCNDPAVPAQLSGFGIGLRRCFHL